ncbi:putative integral membrane protein [Rhodococcus sp. 27YEA15]|uniref:LapA family protein n=1 Tax=Rhodococcus sp. 27YEA15 TaxID=3156259 RepID=UPI003C7A27CF
MPTTPEDPSNAPVYGPADGYGSDPQLPKVTDNGSIHIDEAADRTEEPTPAPTPPPAPQSTTVTERTRTATTWVALVIGAVVLILLLVFIIQNLETASVQIFAWQIDLPLGITVLLSAVAGALIMALATGARILQIRHAAKRQL